MLKSLYVTVLVLLMVAPFGALYADLPLLSGKFSAMVGLL